MECTVSVNTACFFYIELFIEHYAFTMNSRCKFFILFHFKLKGNKEKEKIGLLGCTFSRVYDVYPKETFNSI